MYKRQPVPGGAASIGQVFLLPAINSNASPATAVTLAGNPTSTTHGAPASRPTIVVKNTATTPPKEAPELAVVNLTSAFAASHPSGIEAETLTVLSICGTLHANLPRVTQVRFLVDGQPRATLAGHADLTRTYLAADAAPSPNAHP